MLLIGVVQQLVMSRAWSWRRDQQACDSPNDGMMWGQ